MKFSIGDIVLLKQTGAEGVVTGFINEELVEVAVDGTHFPVYVDELDHPYLKWFTEQKKKTVADKHELPPPEKRGRHIQVSSGFHLSFFPVYRFDDFEDVVDKFKTYFINQTAHTLELQYECAHPSGDLFRHKTVLQPFSHFYLHDIPFADMQDQPRFSWIVEQTGDKDKATCLSDTLRIKRKKLFTYITQTLQQNEPMFSIELAKDFPRPDFEKERTRPLPEQRQVSALIQSIQREKRPKPIPEIDLHMEQLVRTIEGLSNFDMMTIQLEAFEQALDTAIAARQSSMIVIHGVGKGKLKDEIHQILRASYQVDYFQNEWSPRYGYGATQIFFRG